MHVPLPPAIPELPIWLEEKAPIVFPTLLAINGLKLAVIFGKTEYQGHLFVPSSASNPSLHAEDALRLQKGGTAYGQMGSSGQGDVNMYLDASQSNSIFGSSDTVQPAGMYVQMLIRYAT